jgi:hypothetical protein
MKWVETTRELLVVSVGLPPVVEAAMRVMEMDEVLVARMACLGQTWARREKMSNLSWGISGTASMTKSADERSSREVEGVSRARAASACSWVMRCLETSLARSFSVGGEGCLAGGFRVAGKYWFSPTCKGQPLVEGGL